MLAYDDFLKRVAPLNFITPFLVHKGDPIPFSTALTKFEKGNHGAVDPPEGLIWRLEKKGKLSFLAKFVRHDKIDGCYLQENTGQEILWNEYL